MKVQKYEIARVIDKLKSIVQKNDQFPALGGILVKYGYLIASNSEITMKVKLEASEGSYFIIPMKAFDLIKNLPDGEIDISATDKNVVMIKIGAIKNKYQSYPPEEFNFDITEDPEADGVELNGKKIMEAIGHVIYAAADGGANTQMTGIYFEGTDSGVSLRCVLRNGFEIIETSACVDARNYDQKLGEEICMKKIKDKIWYLLGFLLQTAWHGIK